MSASPPRAQAPRASILIVSFNSRAHLPRVFESLERQTEQRFEILLLDNASPANARPAPEDIPARVRFTQSEQNLGFAAGNNRLAEQARAPFVILLNPDAFPEPDWLAHLLAAADANPRAGAIGCTQIADLTPDRYDGLGDNYHASGLNWRGGYNWPRSRIAPYPGETFSACGAAMLVRAEAWRALGGFDETYFCYCEDVDLCFRLRLRGWRVIQAPDAVVRHIGGASSGARSPFPIFHGTRNRTWTFVKNMPSWLFWVLAPAHIGAVCAFLAISPFRGTGPATWRGVGAALAGLGSIWRARQAEQRARTASVLDIARALTWSPLAVLQRRPVPRRIKS